MAYTYRYGDRPLEGLTVQRAIGRGGFGEVYYALADSGKQVALKFLRENPEIELRGIAHVMNLKSPHLITIYDVRQNAEGDWFVIMEYVSGPSLRELMLAEAGGLGPQKAAFFLDGVAKGLAYLHERGIVHRDLKPANIFYDDGYVKIGDYGLSKHISVSRHSGQTVSVGTVHYMAPEIGSGNYTRAIDIYALGVILFELLTGRLPFTGSSMGEILMRHLSDRPDLAGIPEPFASVIAKSLAKDPQDRYQDVNELLDALRSCGDVSASISSFDPATLTRGPRDPAAFDPERTQTTPPVAGLPPLPPLPLDARAVPVPPGTPPGLAAKLQKKADKLAYKLGRHAEWLRARRDDWVRPATAAPPGAAPDRAARRSQLVVLAVVIAAIGLGLGFAHGGPRQEEVTTALVFGLAAAAFGPLLAHFRLRRRYVTQGPMWDRLAYAGTTVVLMIPALAMASETPGSGLARALLAVVAVIALCNWTERIQAGRRGVVSGKAAIWPGILGLILANVFDAEEYGAIAGCLAAAASLLGQAAAAIWPVRTPEGATPAPPRPATGAGTVSASGGAAATADRDRVVMTDSGESRMHVAGAPQASYRPTGSAPALRAAYWRTGFTVLATVVGAMSVGAFFALTVGQPRDTDTCTILLFVTLVGLAWQPFLIAKACQVVKPPLWRGTLRLLVVSAALSLAAGMISGLAFQFSGDDQVVAIFFLVASLVIALVALCITGQRAAPGLLQRVPGTERSSGPGPTSGGLPGMAECCDPGPAGGAPAHVGGNPAENPAVAVAAGTVLPVVIDASAPSFVGRGVNAGLSFLGKLLLLAAMVLAVGQQAVRDRVVAISGELPADTRARLETRLGTPIPLPALLSAAALGSALLLLARRRLGPAHVLRGCAGCALGLLAVAVARGPAASAWTKLLTSADWSTLPWAEVLPPISISAGCLLAALVLLTWPDRRARSTIVV